MSTSPADTRWSDNETTLWNMYTVYCITMRTKQKNASDRWSHLTLAQKLLHREVLTQRNFCTQWHVCAQKPLHHIQFLPRKLLRTHTSFYTETYSTQRLYTEKSLLTCRNLGPKKLLHTEAFAQRRLCTEKPFRRADFLHVWASSWLCFSICPYCRKFDF